MFEIEIQRDGKCHRRRKRERERERERESGPIHNVNTQEGQPNKSM